MLKIVIKELDMNMTQTITTYLIEGKPKGLRTVFISNKICKALVVPRECISMIKDRDEAFRPSLYLLTTKENNSSLYIGESENFYDRLKNHTTGKDFWDIAISFFSQNNDLTKADVRYLEYLALKELVNDVNYNKQNPIKPHLPEHQESFVKQFFDDVKLIVGFLGYNFFINVTYDNLENSNVFYCKRRNTNAVGIYQNSVFVVKKGSQIIGKDNQITILEEDKTFNSPSSASGFVVKNSSNGWIDWKTKDGRTMDEILRKNDN